MEAEPHLGPPGLHPCRKPRGQMTETHVTPHQPISTCSPFQPSSPHLLLVVLQWILTTSYQSRGAVMGTGTAGQVLSLPQACMAGHETLCPPQSGAIGVALACQASFSFSKPLHESLILEGPGPGVGLGPSPWSWSLRVGKDRRALSPGFQGELSQQHSPRAGQDRPCSRNAAFRLHSVPGKAYLAFVQMLRLGPRWL